MNDNTFAITFGAVALIEFVYYSYCKLKDKAVPLQIL